MNEPMTLDRFRELADAYGGVVSRWPERDRAAAMQLALQPAAITILAHASALDDVLDTWTVPAPGMALRNRVAAGAPARPPGLAVRARLWWSGVGIGAALAGAAAGLAAVAMMPPSDPAPDNGTSFGVVDAQGS
jgi:hypothetical protein